jgi:hypothetical protein
MLEEESYRSARRPARIVRLLAEVDKKAAPFGAA